MKKLTIKRLILWALLLLFASSLQAQSGERILRFHSDIAIESDGSMTVSEHITVRSLQQNIRRGIYRDFPTRYRDRGGNRVVVEFEVIEVLRDGQPEPWFTERLSNGVRVNTGDDNFLPGHGEYTFTIRYRTNRQLGFFAEHDELYWNVTGPGWQFPIDQASASVSLPAPVAAEQLRLDHYTGVFGADGSHANANVLAPGRVLFETGQALARGENLTIVIGFPKDIVQEPATMQRVRWFLRDNRGALVLLIGGLGILLFYIRAWLSKGRGPKAGVIIARYEPPPSYSPAGLRYVLRRSYDQRCFSADLIELGVRGFLRIDHEKKRFSETWSLHQLKAASGGELPPSQAALLPKLFEKGSELELKSANASRVQAAMAAQTKALEQRYKGRYLDFNIPTQTIGVVLSLALGGIAVLVEGQLSLAIILGWIVLGLLILIFSMLMVAPTEEGRKLLDHIEGLKKYLSVAEKQDLARLQRRTEDEPVLTPERFEALLPYAIALDVEEAWTGKFTQAVGQAVAEQTQDSMRWYSGRGARLAGIGAVSQSLGRGLSTSIASSSSPPGSSSGGGGGGFSGGGGGGGGGGGR
ncbi:MAG: DUF2207 domain-containing protein [Wenzhouxiangella sp.]